MKVRKECGERSPRSRLCRASPPFRQGGHGDGGADCHSQCAHCLRNDRVYKKCGERTGGGVRAPRPTERLQVVRQSGRTEASAPTERLHEVRWAGRCRHRPLRRVTGSAVGRADTGSSAPTKMCCRGGVLPRPREGQSPSPTHSLLRNTAKKETPGGVSFFVVSRLYLTCCTGPYRRQPSRQRYLRASYQQQHESPAE